jgi:hypothetical protein
MSRRRIFLLSLTNFICKKAELGICASALRMMPASTIFLTSTSGIEFLKTLRFLIGVFRSKPEKCHGLRGHPRDACFLHCHIFTVLPETFVSAHYLATFVKQETRSKACMCQTKVTDSFEPCTGKKIKAQHIKTQHLLSSQISTPI